MGCDGPRTRTNRGTIEIWLLGEACLWRRECIHFFFSASPPTRRLKGARGGAKPNVVSVGWWSEFCLPTPPCSTFWGAGTGIGHIVGCRKSNCCLFYPTTASAREGKNRRWTPSQCTSLRGAEQTFHDSLSKQNLQGNGQLPTCTPVSKLFS